MSRKITKIELSNLAEKVLNGSATVEDHKILNDWFHGFDDQKVNITSTEDIEEVQHRILAKINAELNIKQGSISFRWRMAAVISLLIISMATLLFLPDNEHTQVAHLNESKYIEKNTAYGQKKSIRLPDGSIVKLNSGSSLRFIEDFSDDSRRVILEGEGFFDVVRDETRPFIIETQHLQVQVLGTTFNVKSYENDMQSDVAVKTGSVQVKKLACAKVLDLLPNEIAVLTSSSENLVKREIINEDGVFGWTEGKLVFDNEKFNTAVKMISRWYGVEVEVLNAKNKDKNITANLTNSTLKEVLESLSHTYNFKYEVNGSQITLE